MLHTFAKLYESQYMKQTSYVNQVCFLILKNLYFLKHGILCLNFFDFMYFKMLNFFLLAGTCIDKTSNTLGGKFLYTVFS
jgi:hypothetical protein